MEILKIAFGLLFVAIWCGVIWIFTHLRKVKAELKKDGAMPDGVPRTNLLIWLVVLLIAISSLLLYEIF